jgi:hypothetical protein
MMLMNKTNKFSCKNVLKTQRKNAKIQGRNQENAKRKKSHHPPFEKAQNQSPKIKERKPIKNQKNKSVKTKKRTAKNHEINSEKTKN